MHIIARVLVVATMTIAASACGHASDSGSSTASPTIARSSQVVLTTPPPSPIGGRTLNGNFGHGSDHSSIFILPRLATGFEISFSPSVVQLAAEHTVAGTTYLFVGTVDSSDIFTLHRFHDANADEVVDASTKTTVFTTGSAKAYFTDVAFTATRWFFLDRRCQDVWVADASAGLPTSISSTPFARSADHSALLSVLYVKAESASKVLGLRSAEDTNAAEVEHRDPVLTMEDTTGNDVADSVSLSSVAAHPDVVGLPYHGQTALEAIASHTDTIEVWRLDSSGAEDTLLGSQAVTGAIGSPLVTSIALSPALSEGEVIRVRYDSETVGDADFTVAPALPQLLSTDTQTVASDSTATIVIKGFNLSSGMNVELWHMTKGDQPPTALTFSVTSGSEISVTVPALGSSWEGRCLIQATSGTQVVPLSTVPFTVLAP